MNFVEAEVVNLPFQFYMPQFAIDLLDRHNHFRTRLLTFNPYLMQMAQVWASYMSIHNSMTHGTGVTDFSSRLGNSGYQFVAAGENIAEGFADPASVMKGWMDSPGHKANIINPDFHEVGFGMVQAGPSKPIFWCADFGGSRGTPGITRGGTLLAGRQ